jgi:hypothetical protein
MAEKKPVVNTLKKKSKNKRSSTKKPVQESIKIDLDSENKETEIKPEIKPENNIEENLKNNFQELKNNSENNIPKNIKSPENQANTSLSDFLTIEIAGSDKIDENKQENNNQETIKNEPLNNFQEPVNDFENDSFNETSNDSFDDDFDSDSDDDILNTLFDDNKLLAEFLVEGIDLIAVSGASLLAKDFSSYEKYDSLIPETKKAKLKKPLELLLQNSNVKANPSVVFLGMVLIIYAPVYMKAFQDRQNKTKIQKNIENEFKPKGKRGRPKGSANKNTSKKKTT